VRSDSILVKLREYFSSKPFMFEDASILTGQQEGLYGWVTVNYLLGNFLEVRPSATLRSEALINER